MIYSENCCLQIQYIHIYEYLHKSINAQRQSYSSSSDDKMCWYSVPSFVMSTSIAIQDFILQIIPPLISSELATTKLIVITAGIKRKMMWRSNHSALKNFRGKQKSYFWQLLFNFIHVYATAIFEETLSLFS